MGRNIYKFIISLKVKYSIFAGFFLGIQILGGFPQIAFYTILCSVGFCLYFFFLISDKDKKVSWKIPCGLLILLVWFLGMPAAGLSFAIVFIAGGSLYFVRWWTKLLRLQNSEFHDDFLRFSKVAIISVLLSYIFGVFVVRNSWVWFVSSGAVFMLAAGAFFYMLDAHFRAEVAAVLAKLMHRFVKAGDEN